MSEAVQSADTRAVLGKVILVRRCMAEKVMFLRPLDCSDCGNQFFPGEVPRGLPRCSGCEG